MSVRKPRISVTLPKDKRNAALILSAMLAATGNALPGVLVDPLQKHDEDQARDEVRFLSQLKGEPHRIWARRIAKGLTQSELEFIRSRLEISDGK